MAKVTSLCRVCGNTYIPCSDCVSDNSSFHWREVACSYQCGAEYLRQVLEARNVNPIKTKENIQIDKTLKMNDSSSSKISKKIK